MKQQLSTHLVLGLYIVSSLLSLVIPNYSSSFQLSLNHPLHLWTWISYPFVETSWILFFLSAPPLFYTLKYFERLWGARSLLSFLGFIIICTAILWLLFMYFSSFIMILSSPSAQGLSAFFSAILVAYKQCIPAHRINLKFVAFPVKYVPLAWMSTHLFLAVAGFHTFPNFLILFLGILVSWIYLRFIKYEDGLRGDRNESFSFISFFPEPLHPILRPFSNTLFRLFVKLRLVKPMPPPLDMDLSFSLSGRPRRFLATAPKPMPITGSAALESERRKALALKAVEDRLKQKSNKA